MYMRTSVVIQASIVYLVIMDRSVVLGCMLAIYVTTVSKYIHVHVQKKTLMYIRNTVEPLIKNTLNKGHLSIKDTCFNPMLILLCIIPLNKGHLSIKANCVSFIQRFHCIVFLPDI